MYVKEFCFQYKNRKMITKMIVPSSTARRPTADSDDSDDDTRKRVTSTLREPEVFTRMAVSSTRREPEMFTTRMGVESTRPEMFTRMAVASTRREPESLPKSEKLYSRMIAESTRPPYEVPDLKWVDASRTTQSSLFRVAAQSGNLEDVSKEYSTAVMSDATRKLLEMGNSSNRHMVYEYVASSLLKKHGIPATAVNIDYVVFTGR
jgi:hypothetical protein